MISNGKLPFLLDREITSDALLYQTNAKFENILPYDSHHWMVLCDQRADFPYMRDVYVQMDGKPRRCSLSLFNIDHGIFRYAHEDPGLILPKFSLKTRDFKMYKEVMFTHLYYGLKKGMILDDPEKNNVVRVLFEHEKKNLFDIISLASLCSITGESAVQIGRIDKHTFWCAHEMGISSTFNFKTNKQSSVNSNINYSFIRLKENLNWG